MPWLRLYTEVLHSAKIQKLPDVLFRSWVNLLLVAKLNDGKLPPDSEISWHLRMPEKRVREVIGQLIERKLLDQIGADVTPHDWSEHQFQNDVSTDRVKRFRERRKQQIETVSGNPPQTTETETETELLQQQFPNSVSWLLERWPSIGEAYIRKLLLLGRSIYADLTDEQMLHVLGAATTKKQNGPGLYERTIPSVLKAWLKNDKS